MAKYAPSRRALHWTIALLMVAVFVLIEFRGEFERGIVLGGSGNGEQIAANKVAGVRAALAWNLDTAKLAREHNDANVLSIGARQHSVDEALRFIDLFIGTPFPGEERHARRIAQLAEYETTGRIAGHEIV